MSQVVIFKPCTVHNWQNGTQNVPIQPIRKSALGGYAEQTEHLTNDLVNVSLICYNNLGRSISLVYLWFGSPFFWPIYAEMQCSNWKRFHVDINDNGSDVNCSSIVAMIKATQLSIL